MSDDQQPTPPPLDIRAIELMIATQFVGQKFAYMRTDDVRDLVAECRRLRAALDHETDSLLRLESAHGAVLHDREQLRAEVAAAREAVVVAESEEMRSTIRAATLAADLAAARAALEAVSSSPAAAFALLESSYPETAQRINRDDLGTGSDDIVRALARAALADRP